MRTFHKGLLLICFSLFFGSCCTLNKTKTFGEPCVRYSVVGGANFSDLKEEEQDTYGGEDNSSRIGVQLGARAFMPLNENFGLETGLGFATKGSRSGFSYGGDGDEFGGEAFSSETRTNLTYMEAPVFANYQFNNSKFSVFGGLQPAFLLSAKQEFEETGQESQSGDIKENLKNFDLGTVVGVGYQFGNGLLINASYDIGLVDINASDVSGFGAIRNRSFKISLGYAFNTISKSAKTKNNK